MRAAARCEAALSCSRPAARRWIVRRIAIKLLQQRQRLEQMPPEDASLLWARVLEQICERINAFALAYTL